MGTNLAVARALGGNLRRARRASWPTNTSTDQLPEDRPGTSTYSGSSPEPAARIVCANDCRGPTTVGKSGSDSNTPDPRPDRRCGVFCPPKSLGYMSLAGYVYQRDSVPSGRVIAFHPEKG